MAKVTKKTKVEKVEAVSDNTNKRRRKETSEEPVKRLYRSRRERMLAGVCGGIAEYFDADPTVVRLLWVLITLFWGVGLLAYIIAWIIVPERD